MRRLMLMVAAACLCTVVASQARAQYVTYYRPVTTYYAPAPVVTAPTVTYYSPAPTVRYYAPVVAPTVTYYPAAPRVYYQPAATTVTRYRPFIGGTVTRVAPAWSPMVVY